jgi:cytolysin-activating lysine-acyltransferase
MKTRIEKGPDVTPTSTVNVDVDTSLERSKLAREGRIRAFGEVVTLLMQSPGHRHLFLADLEWLIGPAFGLRQMCLFQDGKQPVGLALWAKVSEEVEKRLLSGMQRLRPEDWSSGDRLWLVELIVPAGVKNPKLVQGLLAELVKGPFAGQEFKTNAIDPKTGKRRSLKFGPKVLKRDIEGLAASKAAEAPTH